MKIKYLGTAAAECIPALFCECEVCKKIRKHGGKDIRTRTQLLINDDLLVDYPPDSFEHFQKYKIDFSKINNLIVTHTHEDHFYPLDFEYFYKGFSHPVKCLPFTISGSNDVYNMIESYVNSSRNQGLMFNHILPYNQYKIGKYIVTPLRATHGTENPYVYIISDGSKTILYCHDSGYLKDEVWDYLNTTKPYFDLVSMDCNNGDSKEKPDCHMTLEMVKETVDKFKKLGMADKNTKVVLNHFSHNGVNIIYKEMKKIASKYDYIVSYDGLEIEI